MRKFSALFIFVFGISAFGISRNLDKVFSFQANRCFEKNQLSCAQNYYEKAFDLGLHKLEDRERYVNSIINEPLDIKSQEKLLKFQKYPISDSVNIKVKYFLNDLKQEIHKSYPKNYITPAVYNQKIIRWGKLPITYSFVNDQNVPEYFKQEITKAFMEWEKSTSHAVMFAEEEQNPNIVINFMLHNPADEDDKKYVVAYTVPQINTNELEKMTINFYLKDPQEEYFSKNQVYNTALHEIVHAIGFMGHSSQKDHIMYITKDTKSIINDTRETLSRPDINTVKLLYSIKPDITNSTELVGDYLPSLVLGDEEEVTSAKIREAKNYIKKAPYLPAGYIDLAEGYVSIQEYPKAIKSLEKALRLADSDEIKKMVYYNLAITYFYIDHLELSKNYLEKAMEIQDGEEMHYLLAEIYSKSNKTEDAEKEYKKLLKNNPDNIDYVIALTNMYIKKKEYNKARKVLKNYSKHNPDAKNNPRLAPYGILRSFM